jgi:peptide/nickel transport system permease protein
MMRFLVIRFFRGLLTLFLVLSFAFLILRSTGDPAMLIMSAEAPPEALEAFRKGWGLDAPLWQQYLGYFKNLAHGHFGYSMRDKSPAMELVLARIPATLTLALPAFALKLLIGIAAGVYAALHRNTWIDRFLISMSIAGYTMPSFVLGLVLVLIFAVGLGWLPSGGAATWQHAILPVITLSLGGAAVLARFTRSAMLEVMGQPYIRTASAKGLVWHRVVLHHAMPNAAIPTLTVIGFMIGSLIAGAVVVESVFSWPGVGRLLVTSVANRDLAVVQSLLLLVATTMVTANLVVDILYGWIDPRVRTGQAAQGKTV